VLFLVALLQQTSFSAIQTELQTAHYIWLLPTALVLSISLWGAWDAVAGHVVQ
jgi:hypothetical protein